MICRFCKLYHADKHRFNMFQYGPRHHAHWDCFLTAKGEAGLRSLPDWAVRSFPAMAAEYAGLTDVLRDEHSRRNLDAKLAAENARWGRA